MIAVLHLPAFFAVYTLLMTICVIEWMHAEGNQQHYTCASHFFWSATLSKGREKELAWHGFGDDSTCQSQASVCFLGPTLAYMVEKRSVRALDLRASRPER